MVASHVAVGRRDGGAQVAMSSEDNSGPRPPQQQKQYDYLLKFLLVGDSDVGKQEILSDFDDGASESPFCSGSGKTPCK